MKSWSPGPARRTGQSSYYREPWFKRQKNSL